MKRIILIITLLLITFNFLSAQGGLAVNSLFGNKYKKEKNAVEVLVKGKELQSYKLTLFRSITVSSSLPELFEIENLVKQDAGKSVDKEVGMIGTHIYYGFYRFPPKDFKYRYLFFRNNALRKGGNKEATLVYMEGYTTIEELKKMFK